MTAIESCFCCRRGWQARKITGELNARDVEIAAQSEPLSMVDATGSFYYVVHTSSHTFFDLQHARLPMISVSISL